MENVITKTEAWAIMFYRLNDSQTLQETRYRYWFPIKRPVSKKKYLGPWTEIKDGVTHQATTVRQKYAAPWLIIIFCKRIW